MQDHRPRSGPMAQLDSTNSSNKHGDNPKTPTTNTPTFERLLLGGGEASRWSPSNSPSFGRENSLDEDFTPQTTKKSVLTKVKEKARKLRHSLSGKSKKQIGDDNSTPSWGVRLDDIEDEEEDAEYLGAPMYESELAPEPYKESARQHPRAVGVIPERHVLASNRGGGGEKQNDNEKPSSPNNNNNNKTPTESVKSASKSEAAAAPPESVTTDCITSNIHGLTISTTSLSEKTDSDVASNKQDTLNTNKKTTIDDQTEKQDIASAGASPTGKIWDKGVSVKEYILNKLEPGEDERALSQVISDVMSPKRSPRGEGSMVEKVKGAVTSLLWNNDQPPQSSSPRIPVSTNAHEVVEDENHGRTLQAN